MGAIYFVENVLLKPVHDDCIFPIISRTCASTTPQTWGFWGIEEE